MRNLQDYINKYSDIASNLGYAGESVEVLVQLLANASYISEVENVTYAKEASLEKSSLDNSKIQHCVDNMYSVYRGACPRVVMKIRPTTYLSLEPYQKLLDSQTFKVYYLGYYKLSRVPGMSNGVKGTKGTDIIDISDKKQDNTGGSGGPEFDIDDLLDLDEKEKNRSDVYGKFITGSVILPPLSSDTNSYIIMGLVTQDNPVEVKNTIASTNTYYIESTEDNLSNDLLVKVQGQSVKVTRNFADHILKPTEYIFDLTIPSFGSRLYLANYLKNTIPTDRTDSTGVTVNTEVHGTWFKHSTLDSYNESELKRVKPSGVDLVEFDTEWLIKKKFSTIGRSKGLVYVSEVPKADLGTIHYKSNRDRYVNSILRSNSDVGTILEEDFPEYIVQGGTSYVFTTTGSEGGSRLKIYYIPVSEYSLIPQYSNPSGTSDIIDSIEKFIEKEKSYYIVTDEITVEPGIKYTAKFDISLELFQNSSENIGQEIGNVLKTGYEKKFGVEFGKNTIEEIKSLISKYSNVKKINNIKIQYYDANGGLVDSIKYDPKICYFQINYSVSASVSQNG